MQPTPEEPTEEAKIKGFWKGVKGLRKKKDYRRDSAKSKASDHSGQSFVDDRPTSDIPSLTTSTGDSFRTTGSDQFPRRFFEGRPGSSDDYLRARHESEEPCTYPPWAWGHNKEKKAAEDLAADYMEVIGPHPFEEDSDSGSNYSDVTATPTSDNL